MNVELKINPKIPVNESATLRTHGYTKMIKIFS